MVEFVADTFTDADGTSLAAHVGETGAAWTLHPSYATGGAVIAGGAVRSTSFASSLLYASGVPDNPDYYVEAVVRKKSITANYAGIAARIDPSSDTYHSLVYSPFFGAQGGWGLVSNNNGGGLENDSAFVDIDVSDGDTIRLVCGRQLLRAFVNGTQIAQIYRAYGLSAGRAGLWLNASSTATTGIHFDSLATGMLTRNLVCDGDSLTAGVGANTPYYPDALVRLLGADWTHLNCGVSGQHIDDMLADAATQVDPEFDASKELNICCCWGGTNNIQSNHDPATVHATVASYCSGRRSAGYKVVVATMLPRIDMTTDTEAKRLAFNDLIRANWSSYADALADVTADPRIGNKGDELDSTYYIADNIHLTAAGYLVVAETFKAAIDSIPGPQDALVYSPAAMMMGF